MADEMPDTNSLFHRYRQLEYAPPLIAEGSRRRSLSGKYRLKESSPSGPVN